MGQLALLTERRVYGTLTRDGDKWTVAAEPHVITRIKRLFGRARHQKAGEIKLSATADVAEDLEWLISRWPLTMTDADAARLEADATEGRNMAATVHSILSGWQRPVGDRTPVRPFRDYQLVAGDLAHTTRRLLLTDDVGLGKTTSAATLFRDPATLPAVVVTLTHLATPGVRSDGEPRSQWKRELLESYPDLNVHVAKAAKPYELDPKTDVVVLNYHKLAGWVDWLVAAGFRTAIFDEIQELRRSKSAKYQAATILARKCEWNMGLSATPIYNYGGELWNVMNVLAPDELGTLDEFGREWCGANGNAGDKTLVTDMAALSTWMTERGLMLRRTRKQVRRELPACSQLVHDLPADEASIGMLADADFLAATMLAGDVSGFERGRVAAEFDMRLRQATGLAKAPYVAEFVRMLVAEGPVVLFGWHRGVYDVWAEQLDGLDPAFYTGHESPRQKDESVARFVNGDTDLLVLSLRSGAGIDGLQHRCATVAFGELDWSPGVHTQCIGRVFRDGQPDPVTAFYLTTEFGSDPMILGTLGVKQEQSDRLLTPKGAAFEVKQADPGRVKALAESWLQSRRLDADTVLASSPGLREAS